MMEETVDTAATSPRSRHSPPPRRGVGYLFFVTALTVLLLKEQSVILHSTDDRRTTTARPTSNTSVGIVVVSDAKYQEHQAPLYETQRDYARRYGYEYAILDPNDYPACRLHDFFFNKHCAVRMHLSRQPENYTLFVLDGDVIAAAPNVSLAKWMQEDADVLFYERAWNYEIMAGNYMVRNTEFGRHFLEMWMQMAYRARTIRGFHSSDNGAIHLVVLQMLGISSGDFGECTDRYQALSHNVSNLTEYYQFVECTRRVLGPNRRWIVKNGIVDGILTILHRYHGFAIDGFLVKRRPGGAIPFHHGEKHPKEAVEHYKNTTRWESPQAQGQHLAKTDSYWCCGPYCSHHEPWHTVPCIRLASCVTNFTCAVDSVSVQPSAYHNRSARVYEYSSLYGTEKTKIVL